MFYKGTPFSHIPSQAITKKQWKKITETMDRPYTDAGFIKHHRSTDHTSAYDLGAEERQLATATQ